MAKEQTPEQNVELASGEKYAIVWPQAGTPLQKNTEFIMKTGSVGTVMNFRLSTHYGAVRLVGATVTVTIRNANTGDVCVKDGHCEIHANPFQNTGIAAYVFDETTANLPEGSYQMEFVVTYASGKTEYYPTSEFINFAKLTIKPNLTR